MTVKTITVTEDAYENVKKLKRGDESFSDLFLRLSKEKKSTGRSIYGILKGENAEKMLPKIKEERKRLDKEMEERNRVFAGQLRGNRADERRKKK